MQVAQLTTCLIVHCPDSPDSRRAWASEYLALYECHYAWSLPRVRVRVIIKKFNSSSTYPSRLEVYNLSNCEPHITTSPSWYRVLIDHIPLQIQKVLDIMGFDHVGILHLK